MSHFGEQSTPSSCYILLCSNLKYYHVVSPKTMPRHYYHLFFFLFVLVLVLALAAAVAVTSGACKRKPPTPELEATFPLP